MVVLPKYKSNQHVMTTVRSYNIISSCVVLFAMCDFWYFLNLHICVPCLDIMDFRCSLSLNMRYRGRICWWVTFIYCVCCCRIYHMFVNRTVILLYLFCFSSGVWLIFNVFYFYLFFFMHRQHVPMQSVDKPMCAWTVILHHVSLSLDAQCAHGCNGEPHVFLRVMLEIICSCYFYTNLSVAFLVNSVVRSLVACLVCCFVCIWFVIKSIGHHPLVVLSLPHALFLQPQLVSMQI